MDQKASLIHINSIGRERRITSRGRTKTHIATEDEITSAHKKWPEIRLLNQLQLALRRMLGIWSIINEPIFVSRFRVEANSLRNI